MVLNRYRESFKRYLEAIARPLARSGITPNQITFLGLVISLVGAYLFYRGYQIAGGLTLLFGSLIDALDGTLARMTGKTTRAGAFLDSTFDRISDGAVLFGIALGGLVDWRAAFIAFMGSYLVSYERCRAELAGSGRLAVGIGERAERLIVIIVAALLRHVSYGVYIVAVIAWITVIQRMVVAYRRLR